MDLETFIVTAYCLIDEAVGTVLAGQRLRQRGPIPTLADSEVLTIEVVGEFLGLDQDTAIYDHFRRHHADLFPVLPRVHRTTFVRQAANLWRVKERVWQLVLAQTPHDPEVSLVDSFPVPVCRCAALPAPIAAGCSGARPPLAATSSTARPTTGFAAMCAAAVPA